MFSICRIAGHIFAPDAKLALVRYLGHVWKVTVYDNVFDFVKIAFFTALEIAFLSKVARLTNGSSYP